MKLIKKRAYKNMKFKKSFKEWKNQKPFFKNIEKKQRNEYSLLNRLIMDCNYYLGFGYKEKKFLWAKDERKQIKKMLEIYKNLKIKPRWIGKNKILYYGKKMLNDF